MQIKSLQKLLLYCGNIKFKYKKKTCYRINKASNEDTPIEVISTRKSGLESLGRS